MCIHESLQLSDEDRTIYCPDCGRDFGRLARDRAETLVVKVAPDNPVLVVAPKEDRGFIFRQFAFDMRMQVTYPCAKCGFDFTCEDGECHS